MFGDEWASPKEISLFLVWLQCQGWAVSEIAKLETHVRMHSHPTSDFCKSRKAIGSLITHQILAKLVNRILRYGGGRGVHVRTCRDAPSHLSLVESTYLHLVTPTHKLKLNPIGQADPQIQKCGLHVRTCRDTPPMTCVKHLVHDPQLTHQNWTQSAEPFLRYRSAVCTCARAEIQHPWLLHKL